jgi:hypothetical protein
MFGDMATHFIHYNEVQALRGGHPTNRDLDPHGTLPRPARRTRPRSKPRTRVQKNQSASGGHGDMKMTSAELLDVRFIIGRSIASAGSFQIRVGGLYNQLPIDRAARNSTS